MSNSYFRFKQFTVQQQHCAMKVTTDSCLFGSCCADYISGKSLIAESHRMLDIGAGTGLLSLMYAQQNKEAKIDAVELDEDAFRQAFENVSKSQWPFVINIIENNIIQFNPLFKYDVIISNPPFYEAFLKSDNTIKNTAHHSSHLTLEQLFKSVDRLLVAEGLFFILIPAIRTNEALEIAKKCLLFPIQIINVKQTPAHVYFRTMIVFGRKPYKNHIEKVIIIEMERGIYSKEFIKMLEPYYLNL